MYDGLLLADTDPGQVLTSIINLRPGAPTVFGFKTAEDPDRGFDLGARGLGQIYAFVQKEARSASHDVGAGGRDSDAIIIRRLICEGPRALGHGGRRVVCFEWSRARRLVAVGLAGSSVFVCFFRHWAVVRKTRRPELSVASGRKALGNKLTPEHFSHGAQSAACSRRLWDTCSTPLQRLHSFGCSRTLHSSESKTAHALRCASLVAAGPPKR